MEFNKRRFSFESLEDLNKEINKFNLAASENVIELTSPIKLGNFTLANRIVALPMEGVDAVNGAPTKLTRDKYINVARGGYGLIWLEATSVNREGMSNDNQLFINEDNYNEFKRLNEDIKRESKKSSYKKEAYTVLQLNHSGRYSNHNKKENAQIATHRRLLDEKRGIESDRKLVTDDYLDKLKNDYLNAAKFAKKCGFNAVDIKSCHGYLLSELLSASDRSGNYGGSFYNRSRFLLETIDMIKFNSECQDLDIAVRLNMADLTENGFSTTKNLEYDLEETEKLINLLRDRGVKLISLTLGNPYYIPYVNKPSDLKKDEDIEDPFTSSYRIFEMSRKLQRKFPEIFFVGVGYTFFRQFAANVAENEIKNNDIKLAGFGREVLAYPDLANDILTNACLDKDKVCITCGLCSKLKANFLPAGCVVRNKETYGKYLKELDKWVIK